MSSPDPSCWVECEHESWSTSVSFRSCVKDVGEIRLEVRSLPGIVNLH